MVSLRLALSNPTLPEITDGYEIKLHHSMGHDPFHDGLGALSKLRESVENAALAKGKDAADAKISLLRCCYASDNETEINSYLDNARFQRRLSEALHQRRQQTEDGYLLQETPTKQDLSFQTMRDNLPIGSVNRVIDRLLEEISVLKPSQIAIHCQLGDFDHQAMLRQIELWGDKIIPAVNKSLGHAQP